MKSVNADRPKNFNNGQHTEDVLLNGKTVKNGNIIMPPPQQRIKKPKTKTQKPVTSPPEQQRITKTPSSPSKSRAPPATSQVLYQKVVPRYPPAPPPSSSGHNYGHQYGNQQGYVVRSTSQNNNMYTVQQRGQPPIRNQTNSSGKPQVIIQNQTAGSSQQQQFIIQTPQEQYNHRGGAPAGQRAYNQQSTTTPVSTGQQQVVIQFHHQSAVDNNNMGQRLVIHPQQLVERRIVATSSAYPLNTPNSNSQTGVVHAQVNVDVPDRQMGLGPSPRSLKSLPQQTKIHSKPEEVVNELSSHPDFTPLPDSFHTILEQIHTSNTPPKDLYKKLKRQFKFLVFENESYQEELRSSQRKLLKLSRDKNFLLDRLLAHEVIESDDQILIGEESDAESDVTIDLKPKPKKKKASKKRPLPLSQSSTASGPPAKKSAMENGGGIYEEKHDIIENKSVQETTIKKTDFSGIKLESIQQGQHSHTRPVQQPTPTNSDPLARY